jgi:plasmid stability protein
MAQVLVRNLDDEVVERLRERAQRKGRSLETELREVLTEASRPRLAEALAALDALRARSRPWRPGEPDSTAMIREDRDSR